MSNFNKYLIIATILLLANLALWITQDSFLTTVSFEDKKLAIADTATISSVVINNKSGVVSIQQTNTGWLVNDKYAIDIGFKSVLFGILNKILIKREVSEFKFPILGSVEVYMQDSQRKFNYASDPNRTKSYIVKDDITYEVEVHGFSGQVIDIFQLNEHQWRNRLIFDGSWRTIQKLTISGEKPLSIQFKDTFFDVENSTKLDSNKVISYLNQFENFTANEIVSEGTFPDLDSLKNTEPMATLSIEDIKSKAPFVLKIFPPINDQSYQLLLDTKGTMLIFSVDRIQNIMWDKKDFILVD